MDAVKMFAEAKEDWLGRFGEAFWKRVFEASGVSYIPLCDIENGRAPAMISPTKRVVVPDFDAATDEWRAYIDSKAKKQSIEYRKARQIRHGIDARNYRQYREMGLTHKKEVGIAIIECFGHDGFTWSGRLLVQSFKELGDPIPGDQRYDQRHMVYWRQKDFADLDSLTPDELLAVAKGELKKTYCEELFDVFGKRKHQSTMF